MALGEAASKCEHIAGVPLDPATAEHMHRLYLAKGAAATTAIEGNSLSEEEAEKILSGQLKLPPSQQYLADEIDNIVAACNHIQTRIQQLGPDHITPEFLLELNGKVLHKLTLDPDVKPGEIRVHRVSVGKYRCAPPEDCDFLLRKLCDVLNEFPSPEDSKTQFCIIKAIFAHLYLVWIHPFGDGNGRTARLLEFYILLAGGFPSPAGHLLSNYYNRTRSDYYKNLNEAIDIPDGIIQFIQYSVQGLTEGLKEQLAFIRAQQWDVAWINYVHSKFHDKESAAEIRRKHVVLELSRQINPTPVGKIPVLSAELGALYYGKTPKTVIRDVNALIAMGMIKRQKGSVIADREAILAFLPWRSLG
jgi:Fic family protein